MSSTVDIQDLPLEWFERPQYRPLLADGEGERWFILSKQELSLKTVEAADCRARADAGLPDREGLVAAIQASYKDWGLPCTAQAKAAIEKLGREETVCVVTGQQPGFLGGPLYVLYKALSAIALARWTEANCGAPCVPVFWVAGEDHDIDEVRTARFPLDGETVAFSLPQETGRAPLSSLAIDPQSEATISEFISGIAGREHSDTVQELARQYHGRSVASGFAALLARLLGDHGLVFIDPEKLRPLARPLLRRCIQRPSEVITQIEDKANELKASGLKPFVSPRFPLFLLRNGSRDHLSPSERGLRIDGGGPELDQQELLELLESSPEKFSAGALLRPIIQDYLLPSVATIGGPAEVGYYAQLAQLSSWLDVPTPRILLRLQASILEEEGSRAWSELGLDPGRLAAAQCAEDLVDTGEDRPELSELGRITERLEEVGGNLVKENPGSRSLERGLRKAQGAIGRLENRIRKLQARSHAPAWKNAGTLWKELLPQDTLQERHWGYLHLIASHGTGWIDELLENLSADPFSPRHRLLRLNA